MKASIKKDGPNLRITFSADAGKRPIIIIVTPEQLSQWLQMAQMAMRLSLFQMEIEL
jgi:hypothetical protein